MCRLIFSLYDIPTNVGIPLFFLDSCSRRKDKGAPSSGGHYARRSLPPGKRRVLTSGKMLPIYLPRDSITYKQKVMLENAGGLWPRFTLTCEGDPCLFGCNVHDVGSICWCQARWQIATGIVPGAEGDFGSQARRQAIQAQSRSRLLLPDRLVPKDWGQCRQCVLG